MIDPGCNYEDRDTCVLVEGPAWGDAEFYGHWLLSAAKANQLLQHAKKDDDDFRAAIDGLEVLHPLDFGLMATVFLSHFTDKRFYTFTIEGSSSDLNELALMVEMGFFSLTGDRYQMTMPENLDLKRVKQAHLRLAATEDMHLIIHPEWLVVEMPRSRAERYESLLGSMNQDQRLADRRALLFID